MKSEEEFDKHQIEVKGIIREPKEILEFISNFLEEHLFSVDVNKLKIKSGDEAEFEAEFEASRKSDNYYKHEVSGTIKAEKVHTRKINGQNYVYGIVKIEFTGKLIRDYQNKFSGFFERFQKWYEKSLNAKKDKEMKSYLEDLLWNLEHEIKNFLGMDLSK